MSATRPWVDAFADEMEAKLAENRHKGDREGWADESPSYLLACLMREASELAHALIVLDMPEHPIPGASDARREEVRREAADVANFAMMIADVAGGLRPKGEDA